VQHGGRRAKHAGARLGRRDAAQVSRWHGLLLVVLLRFLGECECVVGMFVGLLESGAETLHQKEKTCLLALQIYQVSFESLFEHKAYMKSCSRSHCLLALGPRLLTCRSK
jgi:hypothetical protein